MSGLAKKLPIDGIEIFIQTSRKRRLFVVSKDTADGIAKVLKEYEVLEGEALGIPAEVVFPDLADKSKRRAVALRGARHKEGLSQVDLAKNLDISQADLSKMENGKRPIGKKMAKRLADALNIDYRVFL
ncbi:helix-turn-helix transcriptional regulator [Bdellovibrionota bacterium FG-2]